MLALSAQDLASVDKDPVTSKELTCRAMSYRVSAIASLNAAISRGLTRFEQGNAMLATCFALLFQSVYMDDGLAEYMTFIRGTVAVGIQMGIRKDRMLFEHLFDGNGEKLADPAMMKAPLIEPSLVRRALESLDKVQPLCKHIVEIEIYGMLLSATRALITSSRDGKPKSSAYMSILLKIDSNARAPQDLRKFLLFHAPIILLPPYQSRKSGMPNPTIPLRSSTTSYDTHHPE
jgi:hypothetical protein